MKQSKQNAKYVRTNSNDSFVVVGETNGEVGDRRLSKTYEVVNSKHLMSNEDQQSVIKPDFSPLTKDTLSKYFDIDGRVVQESKLRQSLFHGGCNEEIRRTVWSFIFGLYPMLSTTRERKDLDIENHYKYHALKRRWQSYMGDYNEDNLSDSIDLSTLNMQDYMSADLPTCDVHTVTQDNLHSTFKDMARTYAWKKTMDSAPFSWYRVIEKDLPRTDLDHAYFKDDSNIHLDRMKNILATFGFFHPNVGYVQGMNDILTRFLIVLDSEVDAYWCFAKYMERIENDFDETGMVEKMVLVQKLLKELEPNLYSHMVNCHVEDLIFCHRWLLVSFKREFDYDESIRYFEMVQSQYLELDSPVAVSAQDDQFRLEVSALVWHVAVTC
uniref:TBC1 domain family member 15-like n=1 Tax=Phallusia mammillata TaxID=59560 RepID=A0A6F9DTQ0_9ASCI|nr:TBC1 domain family member 15-like [Phallusia mammillata]